jgi:hypothetical protein
LYGNMMDYDYKAYSVLATNGTWYKNVWELVHYFKISLAFQSEYRLGPVRRGDKSLMSEFIRAGYTKADLLLLNIVRMHKMVIHLLDVVRCGGKTIKQSMLSASAGISDMHKFPLQHLKTDWHDSLDDCSLTNKFRILCTHTTPPRVYQYKALKTNMATKQ